MQHGGHQCLARPSSVGRAWPDTSLRSGNEQHDPDRTLGTRTSRTAAEGLALLLPPPGRPMEDPFEHGAIGIPIDEHVGPVREHVAEVRTGSITPNEGGLRFGGHGCWYWLRSSRTGQPDPRQSHQSEAAEEPGRPLPPDSQQADHRPGQGDHCRTDPFPPPGPGVGATSGNAVDLLGHAQTSGGFQLAQSPRALRARP